jgi:hypothetical protein
MARRTVLTPEENVVCIAAEFPSGRALQAWLCLRPFISTGKRTPRTTMALPDGLYDLLTLLPARLFREFSVLRGV